MAGTAGGTGLTYTPAVLALENAFGNLVAAGGLGWGLDPNVELALGLLALVVVGIVAGIINAMAGGGGFLILPLMIGLGLQPGVANGTMRVAVFFQSLVGVTAFHRKGVREYAVTWRLLIPIAAGAGAGSWLATIISDELLRPLFGAVLVAWAIFLFLRPSSFDDTDEAPKPPTWGTYLLGFVIGIYGGFIQAGVGFPLLALLVTHLGYSPVRANSIKALITLGFTVVALPVFWMAGQVAWAHGAALAAGTMMGAYLGTQWQLEKGADVVRYFVLVAVSVSGAAMLVDSLWPYFAGASAVAGAGPG